MTVIYEWDCELVADGDSEEYENEDVIDHAHGDSFRDVLATAESRRARPEPGTKSAVVLVRDDDAGRSWAYLDDDGKLPEAFVDAYGREVAKVPQRFHKEVSREARPAPRNHGRGGARPGSGRPRDDGGAPGEGGVLVRTGISLTEDQRDRLRGLGGSAWVRRMIDAVEDLGPSQNATESGSSKSSGSGVG